MKRIERIVKIIKFSSLFLAIGYLMSLLFIKFNIISYEKLYIFLSKEEYYTEFMFRGTKGFYFYKGFLYLSIGFFFFLFSNSRINKVCVIVIFIALFFTFLRGLIISTVLAYIIYLILSFFYKSGKLKTSQIVFFIVSCIVGLFSIQYFLTMLGDKSASDSIRILQIQQVINKVNVFSIIFGHGFGIGVPVRPVHMEITYLEIFHKQGLIGIFFWLGILFLISNYFIKSFSSSNKSITIPFYLSVLIVYIESFTNPYLINPIGMSITLISFICLVQLYKFKITNL